MATGRIADSEPAHRHEVAIVVAHPAARQLIVDLLHRADPSWHITATGDSRDVTRCLSDDRPAAIVVDAGDIAHCCRASFATFPPERLVVIGPEPDASYERVARTSHVGAWLPRDRVADELIPLVCDAVARAAAQRARPRPSAPVAPVHPSRDLGAYYEMS